MTLRSDVYAIVRSFIGSIPRDAMLLVESDSGEMYHLETFQPSPDKDSLTVHVDMPDDSFETVHIPLTDGRIPSSLVQPPCERLSQRERARRTAVKRYGEDFVSKVESEAHVYLTHALSVFRNFHPDDWVFTSHEISSPELRLSWVDDRRASWGGKDYLSLALCHIFAGRSATDPLGPLLRFSEYSHIQNDPEIGDLISERWQVHLAALIAHETSHFLQAVGYFKSGLEMGRDHGEGWQQLYRILRRHWVNTLERWND